MGSTPPNSVARSSPCIESGSPMTLFLLAISLGLCAGYLDLLFMLFKKRWWNPEGYFRSARDFAWTVPVGHAVLLAIAGTAVAAISKAWRDGVSLRRRVDAGDVRDLVRPLAAADVQRGQPAFRRRAGAGDRRCDRSPRRGLTTIAPRRGGTRRGRRRAGGPHFRPVRARRIRGSREVAAGAFGARNVVLIVWDTVRAYNTTLAAYTRNTTPNLAQWAKCGVTYNRAIAPAPWTYPSHACFFTGQWPLRINAQWKLTLDTPESTLAEFLASRGFQTAGFAANTNCCSYESGLARGFAHYDDYELTPRSVFTRTVPGKWLVEHVLGLTDYYKRKWIGLGSHGAREVSDAFLSWLTRRRTDRPFFAFLNYFDAHEPYIPPREFEGHFGIRPQTYGEYERLFHFVGTVKTPKQIREIVMARDCYDDCIAFLDDQLGRLVGELKRRGLLDNTVVIITSDHGEAFGEHGTIGHSYSVYLDEIFVPLVILAPGAPAGRTVNDPASLRDLPATVVDLLNLATGSPFPGSSLAACWGDASERTRARKSSPALAEQADETAFLAQSAPRPWTPGIQDVTGGLGPPLHP